MEVNDRIQVKINILDKEYTISCASEEKEQLDYAVDYLKNKVEEVKVADQVLGSERIAIMTALHIVHEFLDYKLKNQGYNESMASTLKRVQNKINKVLIST